MTLVLLVVGLSGCNETKDTTNEDKEMIIGIWIDDNHILYTKYLENGTYYESRNLSNIEKTDPKIYKMENGFLYLTNPIENTDWDKALKLTYKFEDNGNTMIYREPWWDNSYSDMVYYRVE